MTGLAFVAAVCSLPLLGYGFLSPRTLAWMPIPARLAAWAVTGAVFLCVEMVALAAFGIPWSVPRLLAVPVVLAAFRALIRPQRLPAPPPAEPFPIAACVLLAVALFLVAYAAMTARATSMDLLLFWGAKAERFARARTIDLPFLRDPNHYLMHSDYPPLLPCVFAYATLVAGRFAPGAALATLPIFLAFCALAVLGLTRLNTSRAEAASSGAFMAALFGFLLISCLTAGNGDAVMLFFETFALGLLTCASARRGALPLASLSLAGASLTKIEGSFLAISLCAAYALCGRGAPLRRRLSLGVGPLAALLGWLGYCRANGLVDSFGAQPGARLSWERLATVLEGLLGAASYGVAYLPWLLLLAILLLKPATAAGRLVLLAGVCTALFDILVYLSKPADPALWVQWSGARLLLTPLLCLFMAGVASRAPGQATLTAASGPLRAAP
jgi:hypothetical protein